MSFGFIILTALSIGLSVAQSYLQKKAADKARRKAFRGIDIRQSFSDQEIPRLYGRTAQEGITVFAETRGNFTQGASGQTFGSLPTRDKSRRNEFLMLQQVISSGECDAILSIQVDERSVGLGQPVLCLRDW